MKALRVALRAFSSGAKQVTNDAKDDSVPRAFSEKVKAACWDQAPLVPGRDGTRWRQDANGFPVLKALHGKMGLCGFEFDHINPHAHRGTNSASNCQVLQSRANRAKSDRVLDSDDLKSLGYDMELEDSDLDKIETAIYGDVLIDGGTLFQFEPRGRFAISGVGRMKSFLRTLAGYRARLGYTPRGVYVDAARHGEKKAHWRKKLTSAKRISASVLSSRSWHAFIEKNIKAYLAENTKVTNDGDTRVKIADDDKDDSPRPLSSLFCHTSSAKKPGYHSTRHKQGIPLFHTKRNQ